MACWPPWVWEQVREEIPVGLGILLPCDFLQKSSRGHASLALENGTVIPLVILPWDRRVTQADSVVQKSIGVHACLALGHSKKVTSLVILDRGEL